jgi:6-hydroxycyclohex-1-ene-1-carbonyl-CoA dehydrogenase
VTKGDIMEQIRAFGYFYTAQNEPLEKRDFLIDQIEADQVVVKVAGCGLCHTDLGFMSGKVQTKHELPLILGHEISGKVIATGADAKKWEGNNVIIPSVLPCGECKLCKDGRDNICQNQKMPGNDFNGGFASHILVPSLFLCKLPEDLGKFKVSQLSVIADAVTTPYQSLKRSNLQEGDLAIVIGVGGIGNYMVQQANSAGAKVIALDIDDKKLENAKKMGARYVINSHGMDERDIKKTIRNIVKENLLPRYQWRVFETSGTAAGQMVAFSLLSFAGSLGVVGFTMEKLTLRLSNIMAFDADVFGNWGCRPAYYPSVVNQILSGKINLLDNIEEKPLDSINEIIPLAFSHKLERRIIFIP